MNKIFVFLMSTGVILGFSAVGIVIFTEILLGFTVTLIPTIVWFITTISVYLSNRIFESDKDSVVNNIIGSFSLKYKKYLIPVAISLYVVALIISLIIQFQLTIILLIPLILVLFYTIDIKKVVIGQNGIRLKDLLGIKTIVVAICWGLIVLYVGLFHGLLSNIVIIFLFFFVVGRYSIAAIVYDMKDIEADRINNTRTLPVVFGTKKTRLFLHVLNIILTLFLIVGVLAKIFPKYGIFLILISVYEMMYVQYLVKEKQGKYDYYIQYLIVDGESILWPLYLFFGKLVF